MYADSIPVFRDSQHRHAIVVVAALRNALRVVEKDISTARIVLSGAGAAGTAILRLLRAAGARDIIVTDIDGIIHENREKLEGVCPGSPRSPTPRQLTGTLQDAVAGADVFIGVSAGNITLRRGRRDDGGRRRLRRWRPTPEIDPAEAVKHAEVVATRRSDFANQINNVLAFPGVFRGLLDAHATRVSDRMLLAAANALADVVSAEEGQPHLHRPQRLPTGVTKAVASEVERVAREEAGTIDTITGTMTAVYADEITLNG